MSTQLYLLGGLVETRVLSDRDLRQLRDVKTMRREARAARRGAHAQPLSTRPHDRAQQGSGPGPRTGAVTLSA